MKKPGSAPGFPIISIAPGQLGSGLNLADFVFQMELAPLQFGNFEIVCGGMVRNLVELALDFAVLLLQLCKMGLHGHVQLSFR